MWNAELDEAQAGIKIARRNVNNLRYADNITLMAESTKDLKNLLMKVKEESEKNGLKFNIQKTKILASFFCFCIFPFLVLCVGEKTILSLLNCFGPLVKNQLTVMEGFISGLCLFHWSLIFMVVPHCFNYCSFYLSFWMPFVTFSCLISVTRTSSIKLNRSGKSKHQCLDSRSLGQSILLPLSMTLVIGFFIDAFLSGWRSSCLSLVCWMLFTMTKGCWILSNVFRVCWDCHLVFILFSVDMGSCNNWFRDVKPFLHL